MRNNNVFVFAFFLIAVLFVYVNKYGMPGENKINDIKEQITIDDGSGLVEIISVIYDKTPIPVGEKNFQALIDYITKNGTRKLVTDSWYEYQYTFFDSDRNEHSIVYIDEAQLISVVVYKDNERSFSYNINTERAFPSLISDHNIGKYIDITEKGFEELILYVTTKSDILETNI